MYPLQKDSIAAVLEQLVPVGDMASLTCFRIGQVFLVELQESPLCTMHVMYMFSTVRSLCNF